MDIHLFISQIDLSVKICIKIRSMHELLMNNTLKDKKLKNMF